MLRNIYIAAAFGCILLALNACKKEKEYTLYPYNQIESFAIVTAEEDTIMTAIAGDSVIVYWPSWIALPEKIAPDITVSANAEISPASGAEVNFSTGTKYTVTAQNGTVKNYYLKVIINQPPIQVFEQTYAVAKGATLNVDNGRNMRYFERDTNITKFFVIDTNGVEFQLPLEFTLSGSTRRMRVTVPDLDIIHPGPYKIRVTSGTQTFLSENYIFGVLYPTSARPKPDEITAPVVTAQGSLITFTGTNFKDMKEARIFRYDEAFNEIEVGTFSLESFTETSATYRIPINFPPGNYVLGGFGSDGIFISLRTSDFFSGWQWNTVRKVYVNVSGSQTFTISAP